MGPKTSADSMLEKALAAIPALADIPIVYENTAYKPNGQIYLVVNNMHSGSIPGVGGAPTKYGGVFQVSVYAPDRMGPGPGAEVVDAVVLGLAAGTKLTDGNGVLYIQSVSPGNPIDIPAWQQSPVSVNWTMYW